MTQSLHAELAATRASILDRIAGAAGRAGRDPADVEIVAVTKTVAAQRIRAAADVGFTSFGENRVQERQAKATELADLGRPTGGPARHVTKDVTWHLVGPLQSNKARRAIELFDVIQTVDSVDLARRLDRIAGEPGAAGPGATGGADAARARGRLRVLLQANVDDDPAKSGFEPDALERDLGAILDLANLAVEGLMTVGRQVDSPEAARPTFAALRQLSEHLRARDPRLGPALSMGMTDDFDVAVEEGATIVRIGRAIFGARPHGG